MRTQQSSSCPVMVNLLLKFLAILFVASVGKTMVIADIGVPRGPDGEETECTQVQCLELGYIGNDFSGGPGGVVVPSLCRDIETAASDSLLAANTTAFTSVWTNSGTSQGSSVEHPSISYRLREWSVCTFPCTNAGMDNQVVQVSGKVTSPASRWHRADYCLSGSN